MASRAFGRSSLILSIVLLPAMLAGQERSFSIEPIAFAIYRGTGGLWTSQSIPVTLLGFGVRGQATAGRLKVITEAIATQFLGISKIPQPFSPEHGFSWQITTADSLEEFSSDYTSMRLTYNLGIGTLFAGKFALQWGPGQHSLFLSEKSPTYPQFGFEWPLTSRLRFVYFHGELFSGIRDSSNVLPGQSSPQKLFVERYIAAHRLEWRPTDRLTLAFNEAVVYGGKQVETMYLLPFLFYFSAEHFLGDADNVQMQLDAAWLPRPGLTVYGVWFLDDWAILTTFNRKENQNHFGWQGGLIWENLVRAGDQLILEISWTDARIYRHIFSANDYANRGYPLGHWTGAHGEAVQGLYRVPWGKWRFQATYTYARRGPLTAAMLVRQYQGQPPPARFDPASETYHHYALYAYRQLKGKLWFEAGLGYLNWLNAGFRPAQPLLPGTDVDKLSLNVGIYYNFSLPGYPLTTALK